MARSELENELETIAAVPRSSSKRADFSVTRAQFFLLLLVYFALHAVLRAAISETAGIDDVDQVLRAQIWSWGYGPQPPLYTWLARIFLGAFGYSTLSLALLKECLVLSIFGLVYASAQRLTRSHACGMAAAALLESMPSISWESHRELTHTVLASALVLATIYSFLRLEPNRSITYVWFGVAGGLGMLAKYNFAIVYVALLLAAGSVRQFHAAIFNPKFLLALLVTLAICAPHFHWIWQHRELAFSSVHKLKIIDSNGWWMPVGAGLGKLFLVILSHLGLLLAFTGIFFYGNLRRFMRPTATQKLFWWMLVWILAIVVAAIVAFRITGPRDRYVQPLFVWLPIVLVLPFGQQLSAHRLAGILGLSGTAAFVILLVAPGRILLAEPLHKHEVLAMPFNKLAHDLVDSVQMADCIIAEDHPLAGNLRLQFPKKVVLDPEVGPLFKGVAGPALLVWDRDKSPALPQDLRRFAEEFTHKTRISEIRGIEERLKYQRRATMRLATALIQ